MISGRFSLSLQRLTASQTRHVFIARCSSGQSLRRYSTENPNDQKKSSSIFKQEEDAWDHVFKDIKNMPPLTPSELRNPIRPPSRRNRKQEMTATELNAFDEMFSMIFDAVSEQKTSDIRSGLKTDGQVSNRGLGNLFGSLRKHSKRMRWTTEEEELLDRKKEAMDLCDTDQELLEWAIREVFDESQKYEAATRKALQNINTDVKISMDTLPVLQSPIYPHLIAQLMRTFRDKYHDPHLALSIFDHARNLSIPSYVFGCTTMAYNELIETKWVHFRDLKGVHDALQEMVVNAVDIDHNTRKIVDALRREVGERNLWIEDDHLEEGERWDVLKTIEELVKTPDVGRRSDQKRDGWKTASSKTDDDYTFNQWEDTESYSRRF
ncbi:hypothetical protein BT96DRAFT_1013243 [Gymnopus androsaceus JB14]|uniref:Mtf2-like C-terminal domain-containing protein n=1 Tax=Gymnopus androsaceus JB14 TaxID=1447944 RepID=A0A6A4IJ03_9AGAR|nr:hypothetical protein BT96DRAFT_1013243 [Gymnopus androsaceus JB14]